MYKAFQLGLRFLRAPRFRSLSTQNPYLNYPPGHPLHNLGKTPKNWQQPPPHSTHTPPPTQRARSLLRYWWLVAGCATVPMLFASAKGLYEDATFQDLLAKCDWDSVETVELFRVLYGSQPAFMLIKNDALEHVINIFQRHRSDNPPKRLERKSPTAKREAPAIAVTVKKTFRLQDVTRDEDDGSEEIAEESAALALMAALVADVASWPKLVGSGAIREMLAALCRDRRSVAQLDFHHALAFVLSNILAFEPARQSILDFTFAKQSPPASAAANTPASDSPLAKASQETKQPTALIGRAVEGKPQPDPTAWVRWLAEMLLCEDCQTYETQIAVLSALANLSADPRFARLLIGQDPKPDSWQSEVFETLAATGQSRSFIHGHLPYLSRQVLINASKATADSTIASASGVNPKQLWTHDTPRSEALRERRASVLSHYARAQNDRGPRRAVYQNAQLVTEAATFFGVGSMAAAWRLFRAAKVAPVRSPLLSVIRSGTIVMAACSARHVFDIREVWRHNGHGSGIDTGLIDWAVTKPERFRLLETLSLGGYALSTIAIAGTVPGALPALVVAAVM